MKRYTVTHKAEGFIKYTVYAENEEEAASADPAEDDEMDFSEVYLGEIDSIEEEDDEEEAEA